MERKQKCPNASNIELNKIIQDERHPGLYPSCAELLYFFKMSVTELALLLI